MATRRELIFRGIKVAGCVAIGEYAGEVIQEDPAKIALASQSDPLYEAVSRLTYPLMKRFATGKYTHDPDWVRTPYLPNYKNVSFTKIPGDPSLRPRGHGFEGLIDSIGISLGDWPNEINLTPDRPDIPWKFLYREGEDFVRECLLAFSGTQSVMQGNETYDAGGIYINGDQVIFTVSPPMPRNNHRVQTPLINIMLQSFR